MTPRTQAERWRQLLLLAAVAASLLACDLPTTFVEVGPADPDVAMRPDLLVADPSTPSPGEIVELTFPEETFRGLAFVLERQSGAGWQHRYDLVSDANGGEPVGWDVMERPANIGVEDVGIAGPGPDRVLIPDAAPPGSYRICTGNAGDNFCTPITIVDD